MRALPSVAAVTAPTTKGGDAEGTRSSMSPGTIPSNTLGSSNGSFWPQAEMSSRG